MHSNIATSPPPLTSPARLYFLDNLRIAAVAGLVVYHVGMYYVTWEFHVKSPFASQALEPWMKLSSPWRMSLLFMVSGAATAIMLRAGASGKLLRTRTKRLLWPLLFGMMVIVPPQTYFEVIRKFHFSGDYLDFLKIYFTHRPWRPFAGFCEAKKCLILPTWNHLWFLPYLWAYTAVLWLMVKLRPNLLSPILLERSIFARIQGIWLLIIPVLGLVFLRWALAARFPQTHAFGDDWFLHAMYFSMFFAGAIIVNLPGHWPKIERLRWIALTLALMAWATLVLFDQHLSPVWRRIDISLQQWCALVAAFGFAYRHWNFDHAWRARLTGAVFPVYILHQTVIILLTQALLPVGLRPWIEAPIVIAATFLLGYASFEVLRRNTLLRPAFGMPKL